MSENMPKSTEELCEYISRYADSIFIRECIDGKWDSYALSELPALLAIKHSLWFVKEGRIPARVRSDEEIAAEVMVKDHPYADAGGYVLEHRLVVEKRIGRFLNPTEHVHHINGHRADNKDENLELLSRSDHISIHAKLRPRTSRGTFKGA